VKGVDYISELIRSTETDENTHHILSTYSGEVEWYTPRLGNNKTLLYMALQKKKSKTADFLLNKYVRDYETVGDSYLRHDASPYENNVVSLAVEQSSDIFDSVEGPIKNNILSIILHNVAKYSANTLFERDDTIFERYKNLYMHLVKGGSLEDKNALTQLWPLKRSDTDRTYTENVDLQRKVRAIVPQGLDVEYIVSGVDAYLNGFP
jgi:hypothetical protein